MVLSVRCVLRNPHPLPFSFLCSEPNLLVRACNQLGQFLQHRETNLRYLALESMCTLASSEFSHEAVKTHIETVINALKASGLSSGAFTVWMILSLLMRSAYSTQYEIPFLKKILLFIHERHRERERSRDRQREKQAPCREPDVGLDPGLSLIHI